MPVVDFTGERRQLRTWNAGVKATGIAGGVGYVVAGNHFDTDGYRDHSAALREIVNAKLTFDASPTRRASR